MNKVTKFIKIKDVSFEVFNNGVKGSTCSKCFFGNDDNYDQFGGCPRASYDDTQLVCVELDECTGGSDDSHYFLKAEMKSLVEEFKEAAGIQTEKTYTKEQIATAFKYFTYLYGSGVVEGETFADFVEKYSDSEYQEYLRLSKKFGN